MERNCIQSACPVMVTMTVIGGKWKPVIIWQLHETCLRFGELQRKVPGVTQKMLTQQLRELESDGIIHREVYPVIPPRVEYSLTERGHTLLPILEEMAKWGKIHTDSSNI